MFKVGDKAVYPMHGAGVIEKIEEKEILGEKQQYFIFRLLLGNMDVMLPVNRIGDIGLRGLSEEDELRKIFTLLAGDPGDMSSNWNRRFRENLDKMKTGKIAATAEVVRDLGRRNRIRGLSTGERKMYDNARDVLASEVMLVRDISREEAYKLIDGCFNE